MFGARATFFQPRSVLPKKHAVFGLHARFKSEKTHPPRQIPAASVSRSTTSDNSTVQGKPDIHTGSAKEASPLQKDPHECIQSPDASQFVRAAKTPNPYPGNNALKLLTRVQASPARDPNVNTYQENWILKDNRTNDSKIFHTMNQALVHKERVAKKRNQVPWPGIWTLSALAGMYGALAYLDVKAGVPSSDGSHLPARAELPKNWELTPEIIRAGLVAGWKELDNVTIGIIVASIAIHLLIKPRPSIWRKLIHVTGEAKWTAVTHPLVNNSWRSLSLNMAMLVWLLPSVVHYFDGDLFHTTAFLVSIPLTTSYLMHLACLFDLVQVTKGMVGAGHSLIALFGVYCVAYAQEKLWLPSGLVLRLDAWHLGVVFWVSQACRMALTSSTVSRFNTVVGDMIVLYDTLLTSSR